MPWWSRRERLFWSIWNFTWRNESKYILLFLREIDRIFFWQFWNLIFQHYRLSRGSRFNDFFDEPDGDFMWLNLNIDEDGEQFHEVEVPETPDDFGIFAFRSYSFTSLMIELLQGINIFSSFSRCFKGIFP